MKLFGIFFLLIITFPVFSQEYKYSGADKKALESAVASRESAVNSIDRKTFYELGLFYERIYDKYKDTSMTSAINCFMIACYTEGDWLEDFQPKAAFRIGNAYEKGKGVEKDLIQAMGWYEYSTAEGKKRFKHLAEKSCEAFVPTTITVGKEKEPRQYVFKISVNPYCADLSKSAGSVLNAIAGLMKSDPETFLEVTIEAGKGMQTPFYNVMLPSTNKLRFASILEFLTMKEDISSDRVIQKEGQDGESEIKELTINFRLLPQQSESR